MRINRCDDVPSIEHMLQYLTDHGVRNALRADGRINVLEHFHNQAFFNTLAKGAA